jgi:hypothetical protein
MAKKGMMPMHNKKTMMDMGDKPMMDMQNMFMDKMAQSKKTKKTGKKK